MGLIKRMFGLNFSIKERDKCQTFLIFIMHLQKLERITREEMAARHLLTLWSSQKYCFSCAPALTNTTMPAMDKPSQSLGSGGALSRIEARDFWVWSFMCLSFPLVFEGTHLSPVSQHRGGIPFKVGLFIALLRLDTPQPNFDPIFTFIVPCCYFHYCVSSCRSCSRSSCSSENPLHAWRRGPPLR